MSALRLPGLARPISSISWSPRCPRSRRSGRRLQAVAGIISCVAVVLADADVALGRPVPPSDNDAVDAPRIRAAGRDLPEFAVMSRGALHAAAARGFSRGAGLTRAPAGAATGSLTHLTLQGTDVAVIRLEIAPPKSDSMFRTNDTIRVTVTFDKAVRPTADSRLALAMGETTRYALYHSSVGTTSLVFVYVVQLGDADPTGISIATDALKGMIVDGPEGDENAMSVPSPTLGVFAIANDARYKVHPTHRKSPLTCDIAKDDSVPDWENICALQIFVAAFRTDRVADLEARRSKGSKTDTLNARCDDSDGNMILNDKDVQKALRHLNLGLSVYCRKRRRQVIGVFDLIKAHLKHKSISSMRTNEAISSAITAIGHDLETLLRNEGLYKMFNAYARGSIFSWADISGNDDTEANRRIEVLWYTRPVLKRRVVFFGKFGNGPLFATSLSMAQEEDADCHCEEPRSIETIVQEGKGVYYNAGIKLYPVRHRLAVFLSGGQTRLSMESLHNQELTSSDEKQNTNMRKQRTNRHNNWFDLGINFRLYDVDDYNVIDYVEKRPLLDSEFGIRVDSRYSHQFRGHWRLAIDFREAISFLVKNNTPDRLVSAMVVVEGELGLGGRYEWPSTSRILILGDTHVDALSHLVGR